MDFDNEPTGDENSDSLFSKFLVFIIVCFLAGAPALTMFKILVIDHYFNHS